LGKLYLEKLHKEGAVTERIFQALPTQIDTTTVAFPGVIENDLLWAGVCPGHPALPWPYLALFVTTDSQTPCLLFIYRMASTPITLFALGNWWQELEPIMGHNQHHLHP
jgi:hypothetical protein